MNALYDGYMFKRAEGPPPLPAAPPAMPKFNPAARPMSKADQLSSRAFRSAAGKTSPAVAPQVKPGILRSGATVKQLPAGPGWLGPGTEQAARMAARGSRLARLRSALMLTPWGAAAEAALIGGGKYSDYLNDSREDFRRNQNLQYERVRQLTGMPRKLGPQATE